MFPMYFVTKDYSDYKLYQNTIYKISDTFKANIIWPIINVDGQCVTMRLRNEKEETSISRSWNGTSYNQIKWTYTGSSIKILIRSSNTIIIAPIISMTYENIQMLPYNSSSFRTVQETFITEKDISYSPAYVYSTDPNSDANTAPIAQVARVATAPSAPSASNAPSAPNVVTRYSLPPHITKIVLADAIRKNEVCPITSEDISETNATVTSCGHVFTTVAINHWLSLPSSKGLCPVCKQKCS